MARASGKEAFRLWFEYLKRAYHAPNVKVDTKFFEAWGDVANTKFEAWWKTHGHVLFPQSKAQVELVKRYLSDAEHVHVSVPMSLTPTEAANQIRKALILYYQAIGHVPKPQRTYELTQGAEIKVSALRAYLVTYDAHTQLTAQNNGEAVPTKELLNQVRKFYEARSHRWRNSKREVEGLPSALSGDFRYEPETNTVHAKDRYDSGAVRTVRLYLKKANALIHTVASGEFPSKDYYK